MKYEPPKGSLSYRLVEYLKTLPAGKWIASGPLSEAMGQPSSAVITAMMKPLAHGLVVRDRVDGRYYWKLGNGVPPISAAELHGDSIDDDDRPKQITVPAQKPKAEPAQKPKAEPAPKPTPQPKEQTMNDIKASPATEIVRPTLEYNAAKPAFRFCIWNDGFVTIIKNGVSIELTHEEAASMKAFLGKLN